MIDKLFISHNNYDWARFRKDLKLAFVDHKTLQHYIAHQEKFDLYTSLEDLELKLENIESLLDNIKQLHFVDITDSFFMTNNDSTFNWLNLIKLANVKLPNQIHGLTDINYFSKQNYVSQHLPRSQDATLFVAGCSITHGVGVNEHERYGEIIGVELGIPTIFLSMPGSSIDWQADRILQADLQPGDMVIWGLTAMSRVALANQYDWKGYPINNYIGLPKNKQYFTLDYFYSWDLTVSHLKKILQVENMCNKLGVKLYLANVLETTVVPLIYGAQSNYIDCLEPWNKNYQFAYEDLGTDNDHPGPKQHQKYAQKILKVIKQSINK